MRADDTLPPGGRRRLRALGFQALALTVAVLAAVRFGERRAGSGPGDLSAVPERGGARPTVLFIFQPGDCPEFVPLFERLADLDRDPRVGVLAVALRAGEAPPAATLGLPVPVDLGLSRKAERLLLELGYRRTPIAVLLDGRGRVRLALPAPRAEGAQRRTFELVREHALRVAAEPEEP